MHKRRQKKRQIVSIQKANDATGNTADDERPMFEFEGSPVPPNKDSKTKLA